LRAASDLHSIAVRRGDVQVDVHRHLRWAPVFAVDEEAVWRTALDVEVQGTPVRTLSDEYTLVFVLLAAFEDLGQGLAKLKQLLDVYLLLRAVDATIDWDAFFARRAAENLLDVTVNVLGVCVAPSKGDELPRLAAALACRAERSASRPRRGVPPGRRAGEGPSEPRVVRPRLSRVARALAGLVLDVRLPGERRPSAAAVDPLPGRRARRRAHARAVTHGPSRSRSATTAAATRWPRGLRWPSRAR
jgi:hypothetical protein